MGWFAVAILAALLPLAAWRDAARRGYALAAVAGLLLFLSLREAPLLLPGASAYIRDERGRILLQRRHDNQLWGLPGGGQNLGESAAQAVMREVHEETGLEVEPLRLIGVYSDPAFGKTYPNGDQIQPVVALFEAQVVGGGLSSHSPETLELSYFPPDDLPPMQFCCRVKIADALAERQAAFIR